MIKKGIGIVIVGLLMATMLPVGIAQDQPMDEKADVMKIDKLSSSQIEITIKGGYGIHAFVKNIGTTDLNDVKTTLVLDGPMIFPGYRGGEWTDNLEAGKTTLIIFPVWGFGATNIEVTIDTTTQTASGMVLGRFIFGVK